MCCNSGHDWATELNWRSKAMYPNPFTGSLWQRSVSCFHFRLLYVFHYMKLAWIWTNKGQLLPVYKSQMKVLLAYSCPTLVCVSVKCQKSVFRGNVYSGSLTLAVTCRNSCRYITLSTCLLICFSHVQLFATTWFVSHQSSVCGILQATILV